VTAEKQLFCYYLLPSPTARSCPWTLIVLPEKCSYPCAIRQSSCLPSFGQPIHSVTSLSDSGSYLAACWALRSLSIPHTHSSVGVPSHTGPSLVCTVASRVHIYTHLDQLLDQCNVTLYYSPEKWLHRADRIIEHLLYLPLHARFEAPKTDVLHVLGPQTPSSASVEGPQHSSHLSVAGRVATMVASVRNAPEIQAGCLSHQPSLW